MIEVFQEEYSFNEWEDDDRMKGIKDAIFNLKPVARKILLTYVESGTYVATAKEFGVSVPTIKKYLKEIKNKIIDGLDDDN